MRLSNYNNKVEPFQDYVVEDTLFHATYIPFTLSWIYSLFTFQVMENQKLKNFENIKITKEDADSCILSIFYN